MADVLEKQNLQYHKDRSNQIRIITRMDAYDVHGGSHVEGHSEDKSEGHDGHLKYDLIFHDKANEAFDEKIGHFNRVLVINAADNHLQGICDSTREPHIITPTATYHSTSVDFSEHYSISSPSTHGHSNTRQSQIIHSQLPINSSDSRPAALVDYDASRPGAGEKARQAGQQDLWMTTEEPGRSKRGSQTVTPDTVLDQSALKLAQESFLSRALSESGEPIFSSLDDLTSFSISSDDGSLPGGNYNMRDIRRFSTPHLNSGGSASGGISSDGKRKKSSGSGVTLKSITPLSSDSASANGHSSTASGCSFYYGRSPRPKSTVNGGTNGHAHLNGLANGKDSIQNGYHSFSRSLSHKERTELTQPSIAGTNPARDCHEGGQLSPGGGTFHVKSCWSAVTSGDDEALALRRGLEGDKDLRIVSSRGTVRGVKHRVKAGIASFIERSEGKQAKKYDELEQGQIVVYTTSMQVVRETHERCTRVRHILQTHIARYEERDVFMSRQHQRDLAERLSSRAESEPEIGTTLTVQLPQIFVDGRLLGGAEELEKLNESGQLKVLLKDYKHSIKPSCCEHCGGYRFIPCTSCHGSKKSLHRNHFTAEFSALRCIVCDENGLIPCSSCTESSSHL